MNEETSPEPGADARDRLGREWFGYVMGVPAPPPDSPYRKQGIVDFVFAEMWSRPGLDIRSRRWITLACVAASDTVVPIQSHIYAALRSGDVTIEEMREFTLHFAVYCGWPKASIVDQVIRESWDRIQSERGVVARAPPGNSGR